MNYMFKIKETQDYEITIEASNYDEAANKIDELIESGDYQKETPTEMYVSDVKCIGKR